MSQHVAPAARPTDVHPVDERIPLPKLVLMGFQHVLIMYTGCVTVPIVLVNGLARAHPEVARHLPMLISADLLVAGIVTVVQTLGLGRLLGVRLPVVVGATFAAMSPMILIGNQYGLPAIWGSMLAAGVFGVLVARPFSMILRFFPPLVTGPVITIIGLSMVPVAAGLILGVKGVAPDYASGPRIALAAVVLVVVLLVTKFGRGLVKQIGVLVGLLAGVGVAALMGTTDFGSVGRASWIGLPRPFQFGAPEFPVLGVISMCIVMMVVFAESTADMLAIGEIVGRQVTDRDLARGLATDGLSSVLGGFMNSFMDTVFAQNVGLVSITRAFSRFIGTAAGVILVVLGVLPKTGAIVGDIPQPVIGGAALVMFGMIVSSGIRILAKVDYGANNNLMIVAVSLAAGMIPVVSEDFFGFVPGNVKIIVESPITLTTIVAFALNLFFNHLPGGATRPPVGVIGSSRATVTDAVGEVAAGSRRS